MCDAIPRLMPIFAFVSLWGFLKLVVPIYKRFELFERVLLCVLTETMHKAHRGGGGRIRYTEK